MKANLKELIKIANKQKLGLGIDVGLKSFASLSNGLSIQAPKPLNKLTRRLRRVSRSLSKKQHPKPRVKQCKA
ncbi:hypothetical protein [Helicobacter fennelliae]|uniref:hypothetical protein n=1 Tax=Helicobacter fennelliae TaxID=215 RepID=UPI0021ABB3D9|nr:hypothetical protein [Helicobacter fennelliae]